MKIIDSNEYIDKYDWTSLIKETDAEQIKTVAKEIIDAENNFKNSPKYQTMENLFARQEPVFLKMRQSFIYSCFMFLGREVRTKNIMSWVFMTNQEGQNSEDKSQLWHNHHVSDNNGTTDTISGIFYVHIPKEGMKQIKGNNRIGDAIS